jgi:endonuclease/exonuclease/phosphatase family metal-dependent hydrolase
MTRFTVMTWNLENLFAPGAEGAPDDGTFAAKLQFIGQTVAAAQADVLAVQELGGDDALAALLGATAGHFVHAQASSHADGRGIRVALLSTRPLSEVREPHAFDVSRYAPVPALTPPDAPAPVVKTALSRGAVSAVVQVGGQRVRVTTAHLKSKLLNYPRRNGRTSFTPADERERTLGTYAATALRNTEAATLRDFVSDAMAAEPGTACVLLGDLNDGPEAASTQILLGPEDLDASRADAGDATRLYNLVLPIPGPQGTKGDVAMVPPERRFSRRFNGRGELIDHVLASRHLLGAYAGGRFTGLARVDALVETIVGEDAAAGPLARLANVRPDHAPILAAFEIPDTLP